MATEISLTRHSIWLRKAALILPLMCLLQAKSFAGCEYDAESGIYYDHQPLLMGLAFFLCLVVFIYPLREWAEHHPVLAVLITFLGPPALSFATRASC